MVTTTYPDRAMWLEARRQGIGSSDAAVILGLSRWSSPTKLFAEKLGLLDESDDDENEAAYWGRELEPLLVRRYRKETTRASVLAEPFTIAKDDYRLATVDGWTAPDNDGYLVPWIAKAGEAPPSQQTLILQSGNAGVLELKTASRFKKSDWEDGPPAAYYIQVQHQLMVTGCKWASLAVLIGGQQFLWCDVQRDDDVIGRLLCSEADFWQCVLTKTPPEPVDGSEHTNKALAALYKAEPGKMVVLPTEAFDLDEELVRVKDEIGCLEKNKTRLENCLKALIGEAEVGQFGNVLYSWKLETRKYAAKEAYETASRVLRRKELKS